MKKTIFAIFLAVAALAEVNSLTYAKLPETSTVDLSVIPISRCGVWASNVGHVMESEHPTFALQMWAATIPEDARIIQLTYDYIMSSDIRDSNNPTGTANSDCLIAPNREHNEGSI